MAIMVIAVFWQNTSKNFFSLYSQKLGIKNLGWTQLSTSAGHSGVTHVPIATSMLSGVHRFKMTSLICVAVSTVCQLGLSVQSLTSTCSAGSFSHDDRKVPRSKRRKLQITRVFQFSVYVTFANIQMVKASYFIKHRCGREL